MRFAFQDDADSELRDVSFRQMDGFTIRTFIFTTVAGVRRAAAMLMPQGRGPFPSILYVHWYEPASPTSNRMQFMDEAMQMAQGGVASLLIETMWSDRDWFIKRTQAEDADNSIQQVMELRQALDIMLADPDVDPQRLAYVGHDFGAMYGVVLGSFDARPTHYVLMAGTPRFHEWYLYYPPMTDAAREVYIEEMVFYDPIERVAKLAPAPVYFQFATEDEHVPVERGEAFFQAAADPKHIDWYEADHGLNESAQHDRMAWLRGQFGLDDEEDE